jgi:hypothetical protein
LPFSPPVARRAARSSGDRPSLGDGPDFFLTFH